MSDEPRKQRQTRHVRKRKRSNIEDRLSAWELAGRGYSLRAIARELKLSGPQQAKNLLEKGFEEFYSPVVEQRRAEVETGVRQLAPVFFRKALKGDVEASREWRELMAVIRKLHGTDTPVRQEHTGAGGGPIVFDLSKLTDEQLDRIDDQLAGGNVEGDRDPAAASAGEGGEAAS